jgi:hypothetical protein
MNPNEFVDISIEEENQLPLPEGWIRVIKYLGDRNADGTISNLTLRVYQNLSSGQESFEHPVIVKALNRARKLPLPKGWSLIHENIDGKMETFYVNPEHQLSMWDPPTLRKCLVQLLRQMGFDDYANNIDQRKMHLDSSDEQKNFDPSSDISSSSRPSKYPEASNNYQNPSQNLTDNLPSVTESPVFHLGAKQLNSTYPFQIPDDVSYPLPDEREEEGNFSGNYNEYTISDQEQRTPTTFNSLRRELQTHKNNSPERLLPENTERDWNSLLHSHREPNNDFEKLSHRVTNVPPPMTVSGINILKSDLKTANERVHQLIMKLRSMLAEREGCQCKFLYYEKDIDSQQNSPILPLADENNEITVESIVTLASDIITLIRQQPDYIIMALSHRNFSPSLEMLEIAFIVVQRVLHPFSTDNSMTTALLLQSINYQLEELSEVEKLFSLTDSKLIISRALLIHNAKTAITWNPMAEPFPTVPNVNRETVLSCLIRVYSLRRDVTGYFRAIWKPLLPSIASLFTCQEDFQNPLLASNMVTLVNRLLILTFDEKSMTVFPITATSICHAIHEISGEEMSLTVLFNYFLLPNLIKIICGDHDSLENESIYSMKNISKIINQYYDNRWWLHETVNTDEERTGEGEESEGKGAGSRRSRQGVNKGKNKNPKARNSPKKGRKETSPQKTRQEKLHPTGIYQANFDPSDHQAHSEPVPENVNQKSLKIISSFIYLLWKFFSATVYCNDVQLTSMTLPDLLQGHCNYLNFTPFHDQKIRNLLHRLRSKITLGYSYLMKMPLDLQSNVYLGISDANGGMINPANSISNNNNVGDPYNIESIHYNHQETYELLDKRIAFLSFKPNEILNLTVISKQELTYVLNEILLAIERFQNFSPPQQTNNKNSNVDDQSSLPLPSLEDTHPIYQLIKEFLFAYSEFEPPKRKKNLHEKTEDFLQLSFLYDDSNNEENILENIKSSEEYISYQYHQLMRGLTLTNRYEDTLLTLLLKLEKNILSNIFELITDQNRGWYLEPEFNIEFKVNHIQIAEKYTQGWKNKVKNSFHGLKKQSLISIFPLFSEYNTREHHPNHISLAAMQKEIIASYRFGSSQRGIDAGTSLARQLVLPPKIEKGQLKVTTLPVSEQRTGADYYARSEASNRSYNNRSIFTEAAIEPNASILAPTQSFLSSKFKKNNSGKKKNLNYQQKDQNFMTSMRDHQIIPTEEFRMRYFQRRRNRQYQQSLNQNNSANAANNSNNDLLLASPQRNGPPGRNASKANAHQGAELKPAPKPFPEHLRNRVRRTVEEEQADESYYLNDPMNNNSNQNYYYEGEGYGYPQEQSQEEYYYEEEEEEKRGTKNTHKKSKKHKKRTVEQNQYGQNQQSVSTSDDPNYFHSLIQDYHNSVKPLKDSFMNISELKEQTSNLSDLLLQQRQKQQNQSQSSYNNRSRRESGSPVSSTGHFSRGTYNNNRSVSPRMPSPMHGMSATSGLLSPTASVAHRFRAVEAEQDPSNEYFRDLHEKKPPELRNYQHEEPTILHPEPFRPTKSKFYQSSGSRIPRVPDFLSPIPGEDVIYSPTGSRSASPSYLQRERGRGRSRSNSPAASSSRSRSRSAGGGGGYGRPTMSSLQARSELAVMKETAISQHQQQEEEEQRYEQQHHLPQNPLESYNEETPLAPKDFIHAQNRKKPDGGTSSVQNKKPKQEKIHHNQPERSTSQVFSSSSKEENEESFLPTPVVPPQRNVLPTINHDNININNNLQQPVNVRRNSQQQQPRVNAQQLQQQEPPPTGSPSTRKRVDAHKHSFAEALAVASKEVSSEQHPHQRKRHSVHNEPQSQEQKQPLEQPAGPQDSKYSFFYSGAHLEDDNAEEGEAAAVHRNRVDLQADRDLIYQQYLKKREKLSIDTADEDVGHQSDNGNGDEEDTDGFGLNKNKGKSIEWTPSPSKIKRKSTRFLNVDDDEGAPNSPGRIPIIKRKSLILDEQESKEQIIQGFTAVKVIVFCSFPHFFFFFFCLFFLLPLYSMEEVVNPRRN